MTDEKVVPDERTNPKEMGPPKPQRVSRRRTLFVASPANTVRQAPAASKQSPAKERVAVGAGKFTDEDVEELYLTTEESDSLASAENDDVDDVDEVAAVDEVDAVDDAGGEDDSGDDNVSPDVMSMLAGALLAMHGEARETSPATLEDSADEAEEAEELDGAEPRATEEGYDDAWRPDESDEVPVLVIDEAMIAEPIPEVGPESLDRYEAPVDGRDEYDHDDFVFTIEVHDLPAVDIEPEPNPSLANRRPFGGLGLRMTDLMHDAEAESSAPWQDGYSVDEVDGAVPAAPVDDASEPADTWTAWSPVEAPHSWEPDPTAAAPSNTTMALERYLGDAPVYEAFAEPPEVDSTPSMEPERELEEPGASSVILTPLPPVMSIYTDAVEPVYEAPAVEFKISQATIKRVDEDYEAPVAKPAPNVLTQPLSRPVPRVEGRASRSAQTPAAAPTAKNQPGRRKFLLVGLPLALVLAAAAGATTLTGKGESTEPVVAPREAPASSEITLADTLAVKPPAPSSSATVAQPPSPSTTTEDPQPSTTSTSASTTSASTSTTIAQTTASTAPTTVVVTTLPPTTVPVVPTTAAPGAITLRGSASLRFAPGETEKSITLVNDGGGAAAFNIVPPGADSGVTVSPMVASIPAGGTVRVTVTVNRAAGPPVSDWATVFQVLGSGLTSPIKIDVAVFR